MPLIPSDGARFFSKLFGTQHGAPSFNYIHESGVVWQDDTGSVRTGAFRPLTPVDLAQAITATVDDIAITGTVATVAPTANNVSNVTPSGTNGLALSGNAARKTWFIQNNATGNSPLFVRFTGLASTQQYNMVLGPASSTWAGNGGSFNDDRGMFKGNVYVSGLNAIDYIIWELT